MNASWTDVFFSASEKRDAFDDVSDDSWPELVGRTGTYAVEFIKKATGKSGCHSREIGNYALFNE